MKHLLFIGLLLITNSCTEKKKTAEKPNVLFIAIDDLADWVGCMGHPIAKTPNIDRLAKRGTLFTNAHTQAPICGPSRAAVMSGLYPTTSGNYLQLHDEDIKKSNAITAKITFLPDYFEQNAYKTMAVGKLFHQGDKAGVFMEYGGAFEKSGPKPEKRFKYDPTWFGKSYGTQTDWGAFPDADEKMPDYKSATWAEEQLGMKHEAPFFMGVGFVRPHVPFYVPQKWFDAFPIEEIELPAYLKNDMDDVPEMGQRVAAVPAMPSTEWLIEVGEWKNMVQAYLACIYFVDAQIGRVLDALENSAYKDNTIVVLWADHGYHLGEKNRTAKQSLWHSDTHSLLLINAPNVKGGTQSNKPVQLIDIYPTLTELCGLPGNVMNEGHSLLPLLQNPHATWAHKAISSYGKGNIAITGERYRLIQYEDESIEFYALENDIEEWHNLHDKAEFKDKIEEFKTYIPKEQAELSPYSSYKINPYFIQVSENL